LPPLRGQRMVASRGGSSGEILEWALDVAYDAGACLFYPLVEAGRARHVDAVEEGRCVECNRRFVVSAADRSVELADVGLDRARIDRELLAAEHDRVAARVALERVERLVERMASAVGVGLRPEEREQLVARDAARSAGGNDGEHRESPPRRGCGRGR